VWAYGRAGVCAAVPASIGRRRATAACAGAEYARQWAISDNLV
jgi:hypothetical protein